MYDKNQAPEYSKAIVLQNTAIKDGSFMIVNNPATDQLTVSYSSAMEQSVEIKIYDLAGRMRMNQKTNVYQGSNFINLALSSAFKAGIYVVEVINASERQTAKFVKQ
jgi:myo-inositol-hexaphosphate 3-phosphohydrolase